MAADPAKVPGAQEPAGWDGSVYYRLHGSPRMYYSSYAEASLEELSETLIKASARCSVWCLFDNTAAGAAIANALFTIDRVAKRTTGHDAGSHDAGAVTTGKSPRRTL